MEGYTSCSSGEQFDQQASCFLFRFKRIEVSVRMRNLELLSVRQVDAGREFQGAQCVCVDYDSGNVFAASPATIIGLSPQNEQVSITFLSINNPLIRNIVFILVNFLSI